ncbi:MAG: hypothetical protein JNK05_05695 [Myxococcales bacterium]|nr:hypothetical protein [Myxococcales bacterium]
MGRARFAAWVQRGARDGVGVEVHHGTTCAIDAAGALRCIGASRFCDSGAPAQWSARTFYPMRWE